MVKNMKKSFVFIAIGILLSLILSSCQGVKKEYPTKVVKPQAPFLDENIEIINQRVNDQVDRHATISAHTATKPVRFLDRFTKGIKGISDANPYDRTEPYYHKEFQKDMLAESMQGVTQPTYVRGERYGKAYRSPFIFKEELERGGTSDMTTISDAASSPLARDYLDFQKDLETDLNKARKYYEEGKYSEALELVDKVMDMDTSSQEGRILFEKIVKTREEEKQKREAEIRSRIEKHEKISRYIGEAREYLAQNNYSEALRIGKKATSLDPTHQGAREFVDTVELSQFENKLRTSGVSSLEILERMIYKHLKLYQQYSNENLGALAKKELQKVSILESYRDKVDTFE